MVSKLWVARNVLGMFRNVFSDHAKTRRRYDHQYINLRSLRTQPGVSHIWRHACRPCGFHQDKYAAENIRMNNVLPGFIDSLPEKDEFRSVVPMVRYGNSLGEIASVVAFLASEGDAYITGQNIHVDGGITRSV